MKRAMDIIFSILALGLLAPLMGVVAILIFIFIGKPVIFRQQRPGLYGRPFIMYKFRTMYDIYDGNGNPAPDADRLGRFGQFLRSTSLDELPELFNVLKGEMSLVGPRPLLMEYLDYYTPEQARRQDVVPGITGLAQVNGRNAISWEKKFKLDIEYVDQHTLWLDIKILWMTLKKVFLREGISSTDSATMDKFKGYK